LLSAFSACVAISFATTAGKSAGSVPAIRRSTSEAALGCALRYDAKRALHSADRLAPAATALQPA